MQVNHRVKQIYKKQRNEEKEGQDLMRKAFSPTNPLLVFEPLDNESAKNVQEGYMQIFAGAIQGIRNPKAHENLKITQDRAIKHLILQACLWKRLMKRLYVQVLLSRFL